MSASDPMRGLPPGALSHGAPIDEASEAPAALVVGHSDCRTSRRALALFERLHRRRTRGVLMAVLQDSAEAAGHLARELALSLPIRLEDVPYEWSARLGIRTVPTLLLLGSDGCVEARFEGLSETGFCALAERLGVDGPLAEAGEVIPAFVPG